MRLFGGMLIRQQKEDDLEGKDTGGWSVREEVISVVRVKVWK